MSIIHNGFRFIFLSSLLFLISASAYGQASSPSAATPWGISANGSIGPPQCPLNGTYFASPGEAETYAEGVVETPLIYQNTETQEDGTPLYNFNTYYFSVNPNCAYTYYVGIGYAWDNYGETCPDGTYYEDGAGTCTYMPPPKLLGNPKCHDGCVAVGDPIDAGSGNVYYKVADYKSAGSDILEFTRHYNSLANPTTYAVSLGSNWRTNYDRYLDIISGTSVTIERADGQGLSFTYSGSAWVPDSDVDITLTQSGSGTGSTWTLTDHDDTVETYTQLASGEGQLNSIVLRNGYTQTLTYNGSNQLTGVTDSFSRSLSLTYSDGLLDTVTAPNGLVLTYGYDDSDRLISVSYNTSPTTSQSYSYSGGTFLLASVTDEDGNTYASWTYDSYGRGLTSQLGTVGANLDTVSYVDGFMFVIGSLPTATNALGEQALYRFANQQNTQKITEIDYQPNGTVPTMYEYYTYDGNGYRNSYTDRNGELYTYTNNSHGDPTSITDTGYSSTPSRTTTITYDATWVHLPDSIAAPNKTTTFTYDGNGNVLTRTETDTTGGPTDGETRTWTYTYNAYGQVLTVTGPRTDVTQTTTFTYSGANIATVTDALGHEYSITSYNGSGLPLSMTDPNGVVITFTYDARDRLLTRTVSPGGGDAVTTYTYDAAGNLTSKTMPDGSSYTYDYDTAHRLTDVTDGLGNYVTYTLDALGDHTQTQLFDSGDTLTKTSTAAFDALGRELQYTGASDQDTYYTFDNNGNVVNIEDPLGNSEQLQLDVFDRLINDIDRNGGYRVYSYDAANNILSITEPNGMQDAYTYDGFGHMTSLTSSDYAPPYGGTASYTLDLAGNRTSETDPRSIVTNRTFDKLNRVTAESYPAASSEDVAYTYDSGTDGVGHLSSFTDESGSTTLTYNERGDVLTDTRVIGSESYENIYTYDLADHVSTLTYPSGDVVTYTRDGDGRISGISYLPYGGSSAVLISSVTYEPFGGMTGMTYGNSLTGTYTYDQDYRLTDLVTSGSTQDLSLDYDDADNLTSIDDGLDSTRDQTLTYDNDYLLLSASGKYGSLGYNYDSNQNRQTVTDNSDTLTWGYIACDGCNQSNLQQTITDENTSLVRNFTYDNNGNIATDDRGGTGGVTFTYGNRNRMEEAVVSGGDTATYAYNAYGQRVLKTIGTTVTAYQYDTNGHLIAESDNTTGDVIREYVYMDDLPVAQIESDGTTYYIHNDQIGTPQKMTDSGQSIVWDRIQDPFGQDYSITGTATQNLRFPGQYYDAETATNQNWFRSYDSTMGRYLARDPLGVIFQNNAFSYAQQNPFRWVDPMGLASQCPDETDKCKKVKDQCIQQCSDSSLPTYNYGWKFVNCYNKCMADNGCGPDGGSSPVPDSGPQFTPIPQAPKVPWWLLLPVVIFAPAGA